MTDKPIKRWRYQMRDGAARNLEVHRDPRSRATTRIEGYVPTNHGFVYLVHRRWEDDRCVWMEMIWIGYTHKVRLESLDVSPATLVLYARRFAAMVVAGDFKYLDDPDAINWITKRSVKLDE